MFEGAQKNGISRQSWALTLEFLRS
jgi:hypothetical protein